MSTQERKVRLVLSRKDCAEVATELLALRNSPNATKADLEFADRQHLVIDDFEEACCDEYKPDPRNMLVYLLKQLNVSVEEASAASGVTELSAFANLDREVPSREQATKLASYFEVPVDVFLVGDEHK